MKPLEVLEAAIQEFVNASLGEPTIIRGAVVAWESMTYDDDGGPMYQVKYASLNNASMASCIGIMVLGKACMMDDMLGDDDDDA